MAYNQTQGNEFWFQFDLRTKYSPQMGPILGKADAFTAQDRFHNARKVGQYPAALAAYAHGALTEWKAIADVQRKTVMEFFGNDRDALRQAFEDFGQGVLLDTREPRFSNDDCVHMMDTGNAPPIGYHRWNAAIRTIQTFDNDTFWDDLAKVNALAWAIQSKGRPKQSRTKANLPIAAQDLASIRNAWTGLTQDQIDKQFDLGNGTSGYHPSPLTPVV